MTSAYGRCAPAAGGNLYAKRNSYTSKIADFAAQRTRSAARMRRKTAPRKGGAPSLPESMARQWDERPVPRQKKTRLNVCETSRRVKKFPAPCYSPIVKFTVPSPLEPLTAVFGKGTCVSAPLSAPEKITIKKTSPGIISKIKSSRLPTSVESTFFSALHAEL